MLNIPARIYSKAIWDTIRYRTLDFESTAVDCGPDSIAVSLWTADMLNRIVWLFRPETIVEIGTGTGRSTLSMIAGSWNKASIHTCDTEFRNIADERVKFYHSASTEMLRQLKGPVDFWFIDGRLQPADIEHVNRLSHKMTTFAFDDFEGVEKGVCNALAVQHLGGVLVYPPDGHTLALMIPKIGFSRQ